MNVAERRQRNFNAQAPLGLLVRQRIELQQRPECQARYFLDPAHAALVGLIGTERGFQTRELARLVDHIGAGRRPPGIVDEGYDLPIGERNLNTAIFEINGPEHRTRENGDAFTEAPRVLQQIVF